VEGGSFKEALNKGIRREFKTRPGPCYVMQHIFDEALIDGALRVNGGEIPEHLAE
jgi:hypothetical protein